MLVDVVMSEGKKNQKLQPVSNVLQSLFSGGKSPLSDQFLRWRVWRSWAEVVGPAMEAYSSPVGYNRRVLIIWVKSAAHMQEMSYGKDLLRAKVNQFVGFDWIDTVKFTLDRKDVPTVAESEDEMKSFLDP
jgi:hypothetical protein